MPTSRSGRVNITITASPSPVAPNAAAWADSRSRPSRRLAMSKPKEKTPARRYIGGIIEA
jgi:hypothetical protein